jgi:FkbM family methyltransferase
MKQVYGIWFPESDTHFQNGYMNENGDYQKDAFDYAMSYVKEPKIFYDIGAHVGLWSMMARKAGFRQIEAFEPNPETYECLLRNLSNNPAANLYNYGISNKCGTMSILQEEEGNSGAIKLIENDFNERPNVRLNSISISEIHKVIDGYRIKTHDCLVKIDTEGMEADCVLGMDKILYALRPVVCVEQRTNKDAVKILEQMGMQVVNKIRKDYILTWKNQ